MPARRPLPPGDLSAVLRKRLAQATPAAQETAGLAAAVGTNFSLDLLTEASDLAADGVVAAVDELWRNRILREFGAGDDFSHDLLREAAYAEVTPARRWLLHRRVAQGLELLHAGDVDAVAAQLAAQYARAGGQAKAAAYYRRAGQVAAGRFAYAEAIRLYREGLSVIKAMPEGRDRDSLELSVLTALAAPLNAREGYASRALERDLQRSVALAESLGRGNLVQTGLIALSATWFVQGRTADCHQVAARALALAAPGSSAAGQAEFIVGGSAIHLGRPAEGLRHLAVAAGLGGGMELLSVGTRADVHATAWGAHAHWLLGDDETAARASQQAVDKARAIDDPYNVALALAYSALTHQMRHDLPRLREVVTRAARPVRTVRIRLLPPVGADPGRLVRRERRRRPGHPPGRAWHRPAQGPGRLRPAALLAVAARRPAGQGGQAGRRQGDPRRRPHGRACLRRPVVAARGDADARGLRPARAGRRAAAGRGGPRIGPRQRRAGPPLRGRAAPPGHRVAGRRAERSGVTPNATRTPRERPAA